MSGTHDYIQRLESLKAGDLGLLRTIIGKGLDETVMGFDLFAGIWWPLRQKNQYAPRRSVSWLIAKLYAFKPIPNLPGNSLASQLKKYTPSDPMKKKLYYQKYDRMITSSLDNIEPYLQWAVSQLANHSDSLDWAQLTDDLSAWDKESVRLKWTETFLGIKTNRREQC